MNPLRRRLFLGLASLVPALFIREESVNPADVLANPNRLASPVVRYGTIIASPPPTGTLCSVQFPGAEPVALPFLAPYVPMGGDWVAVLFTGVGGTMSGLVLGGRAGQSGNRILNGDFGMINPSSGLGVPPQGWTHYRASGSEGSLVSGRLFSVQAKPIMRMQLNSASASDNYAYSAAWPVKEGDVWRVEAIGSVLTAAAADVTVELLTMWFGGDQTPYPAVVASNTLVDTLTTGFEDLPFGLGSSTTVTTPAMAQFARAAIRVTFPDGGVGYTVDIWAVHAYKAA